MSILTKSLIAGAAAAFVLAVVGSYTGTIMGVSPEGFSRASTNLALIAIALAVTARAAVHKGSAT
jgi:hypothetical protein